MRQEAPDPEALAYLVGRLSYKAGWTFRLADLDRGQGSAGLTLVINITGPDSYHPERQISVNHYFIVPAAAYDGRAWQRWLLDQVLLVEQHEACEFFRYVQPGKGDDGSTLEHRPYKPNHGPGRDPYEILTLGTAEDADTSFRGVRNHGDA